MTALELLKPALDSAKDQLERVFKDLPEDLWNRRLSENTFSPIEQLEHLAEVYQATITLTEGGKHKWGSFSIADKSPENMLQTTFELRKKAESNLLKSVRPDVLQAGMDYIVLHDGYHVGQMAMFRMALEPSWDPYSIYSWSPN